MSNIAPFFIVEELGPSVAFYVRAGFDVRYSAPAQDPFFAIVGRDETRIFLKQITGDVLPLPNPIRHHWAPWDAFGSVTIYQPNGKYLVRLNSNENGGLVYVFNKTGEGIAQIYADDYGNGVVGAFNRKGKGDMLKSGP